jgi:hypothetical protein
MSRLAPDASLVLPAMQPAPSMPTHPDDMALSTAVMALHRASNASAERRWSAFGDASTLPHAHRCLKHPFVSDEHTCAIRRMAHHNIVTPACAKVQEAGRRRALSSFFLIPLQPLASYLTLLSNLPPPTPPSHNSIIMQFTLAAAVLALAGFAAASPTYKSVGACAVGEPQCCAKRVSGPTSPLLPSPVR